MSFSREQSSFLKAKKTKAENKNKKDEDNKDNDYDYYRGFQRRDIEEELFSYAKEMYEEGVRDEQILMVNFKNQDTVEESKRLYKGGVTSFFNPEVNGAEKLKQKQIDKLHRKSGKMQL